MTEHDLEAAIKERIAEVSDDADLLRECIDLVDRLRRELEAQRETVLLAAQVTAALHAENQRLRRALGKEEEANS